MGIAPFGTIRGTLRHRRALPLNTKGGDASAIFGTAPGAQVPSLAPCLRVRLGGRHGGSATSCCCTDPCTTGGKF